jgi:hypothetical protein
MARAVWHAVTLFMDTEKLDKPVVEDLEVLRIFDESLCNLVSTSYHGIEVWSDFGALQRENVTAAFENFKDTQKTIWETLKEKKSDKAMGQLLDVVNELSNCDDLSNLIEVQDVKDELYILRKLFKEQCKILQAMITEYGAIDKQNGQRHTHERAIGWLRDAKSKVSEYIRKVNNMMSVCDDISRNVRAIFHFLAGTGLMICHSTKACLT